VSETLRLPLTDVKESGLETIERVVPSSLFPDTVQEGELFGDLEVKGLLTKQEEEAAFDGHVTGHWRIECTRCLAPVESQFKSAVETRASIDGGPMDITDDVRQAIVLAQPLKTLCRPDCKGFCQVCRKNLNTTDCGHDQAGPSQGRIRLIPPEGR
jgi:uncharacterized protein